MADSETSSMASKPNPQVNIAQSTATRMWMVFCCALCAVIQSAAGDSGASFAVAIAALVSAVLTELLLTSTRHGLEKIMDGSAAASAMVLTLMLPNHIHPVYAALGAAFAIVVVKHSFGGLGSNWLNPALGAWLFIRFSWPQAFTRALDGLTEDIPYIGSTVDNVVSAFLNKYIFPLLGTELPQGYIDLFSIKTPGIIADRAILVLVIGIAVIAAFEISRSWFSILYLVVFCFLVRMMGASEEGLWWEGDVIHALLSGGTLVAAFFLVVDPSSGAKSAIGNVIAVILAAALGFAFRYLGNVFYGAFFAVALVNAFVPLFTKLERRLFYTAGTGFSKKTVVSKGAVVSKGVEA